MCKRPAGKTPSPPFFFFFFYQSLKISRNSPLVHTEGTASGRERMHLLFLLPFLKLCCFTNQVKQRGKRRGEAVSKGTDLTQIFETHAQDPPPCIKKKKKVAGVFFPGGKREKEMNGKRNAGDKRVLSAGEWECWRDHCSSPIRFSRECM